MRVLVTGATGFVGSWVVRELSARGHAVRALVRPTSSLANLDGLALERAEGDVTDRPSVERALRGCEAVVHTAGVLHFRSGDDAWLYGVNHASVGVVLGAALRAGVSRAVLTSSEAAMAAAPGSPRSWTSRGRATPRRWASTTSFPSCGASARR